MAQLERYQQAPLPVFNVAAFYTLQKEKTASLALAVVFPQGVDAQAAAERLAGRITDYTSVRRRRKLDDRWAFDQAVGFEANGLPVALVVMRAEAKGPTKNSTGQTSVAIWNWAEMVLTGDTLFLWTEP